MASPGEKALLLLFLVHVVSEQEPGQTHRPEQKPGQTHRPEQKLGQTHRPEQEPGQTHRPEQEPGQTHSPEGVQKWPARPPQPDMTMMPWPSPCPPSLVWLKIEVMKMMGPFLSGLPMDDIQTIPNDQLCQFFHSPQFPSSFRGVGGLPPLQGRKILQKIRECSQKREDLVQNLDRCLKKKLANTVMSSSVDDSSPELLHALGPGVMVLSPFRLSQFSPDALKDTLMSLGSEVKWGLTQAKTLANKLLQGKQIKSQGLLGNEGLDIMTQKMTRLQRKALLEGKVPASLLSSLSLTTLDKANLTSLNQLEGKQWTRAQSAFLVRKILGKKMTLTGLEKKRAGYFNNITDTELEEIPTLLLLHLGGTCQSCPVRNMSGSLLCELAPSQMPLLAPEVLNSTVQALASCTQIPPRHWRALFQLLNDTYSDPSDWTADTMKSLGPLLLLDDSAVRSLRFKCLSELYYIVLQAWGPVSGLNESQVLQLGCVSQGFNLTELPSLPFSSLDTLSRCSWTQ
ncbi:unnamed protein product [Coregonus sp. 'balchen']|nr:unnamed protein product [Coregonus sp. 'balchen']